MVNAANLALRKGLEQFCLDQMAENRVTPLSALLNQPETVQVGKRSPKQSLALLRKLGRLPCNNVYLLDAAQVESPGSAPVVSVNQFVLELPKTATARREIRSAVASWMRAQGQELRDDAKERFLYFSVE